MLDHNHLRLKRWSPPRCQRFDHALALECSDSGTPTFCTAQRQLRQEQHVFCPRRHVWVPISGFEQSKTACCTFRLPLPLSARGISVLPSRKFGVSPNPVVALMTVVEIAAIFSTTRCGTSSDAANAKSSVHVGPRHATEVVATSYHGGLTSSKGMCSKQCCSAIRITCCIFRNTK